MTNLKGLLFNQFANEGLGTLIEDLQKKYKSKKGRRFHHENITYEIGRPHLKSNALEFEISSKIPQDEISDEDTMEKYFDEIKKSLNAKDKAPSSIERENIVWDSKKENEKERDYIKLSYSYPLNTLFSNDDLEKIEKTLSPEQVEKEVPNVPSVSTLQGKIALKLVRDHVKKYCNDHVSDLIDANQKIRKLIKT